MNDDTANRIIKNQIMLTNLMGALLYKLTGAIPLISTNINKDEKVIVRPDLFAISYQEEDLQSPCQLKKGHDKHSQPDCISGAG